MATDTTVAKTILEQLGGRKFLVMTGANNLIGSSNSLKMRLPNALCDGKRCSGIIITLDPSDTYTVQAVYIRKLEMKILKTVSNVYCDNLQEVFTSLTGLYTSLGGKIVVGRIA